jgi:hypothetical protein
MKVAEWYLGHDNVSSSGVDRERNRALGTARVRVPRKKTIHSVSATCCREDAVRYFRPSGLWDAHGSCGRGVLEIAVVISPKFPDGYLIFLKRNIRDIFHFARHLARNVLDIAAASG